MNAHSRWEDDPAYLRFRRRSVFLAVWTTLVVCSLILIYLAASWDHRNRAEIAALAIVAIVSVLVIVAVHAERLVETRWVNLFFGAWSTLDVAIVVAVSLLDGGARSPLALTFFLVLVFAALCYPLRLAAFVGAACIVGYLAIAVAGNAVPAHDVFYFAGMLVAAAVMCSWQAHTSDRQRRELAAASRTDPLTGCFNRRGFDERLEAEIARAEREGDPVALVLFDLDGFKNVNDAFGHAAGDDLLRWVVERSAELLRPADSVGRLGGDEFALLLPQADSAAGHDVLDRLVAALHTQAPISAGVAVFPFDGGDGDELLRAADVELYRHKQRPPLRDEQRPEPAL